MSQGNTVATTILAQLGGAGRLSAMIGAYNFMSDGPALIFKFRAQASKGIKAIKVTLDPSDTYTVRFWRIGNRGLNVQQVAEHSDVYADNLKTVIEYETGLRLSL
jgi:hypothetical protein